MYLHKAVKNRIRRIAHPNSETYLTVNGSLALGSFFVIHYTNGQAARYNPTVGDICADNWEEYREPKVEYRLSLDPETARRLATIFDLIKQVHNLLEDMRPAGGFQDLVRKG